MTNNKKPSILRYGPFLLAFMLGHIVTRLLYRMEMLRDDWHASEIKSSYNLSSTTDTTSLEEGNNGTKQHEEMSTPPPSILYGHVHMAKTGGTTLNGLMALKYERVCGHKGYSYDAFQDNERRKNLTRPIRGNDMPPDSIYKVKKGFYRHRVPRIIMDEIGYEDCDWVSFENMWEMWNERFASWHFPLELHVPCRDPIDHLMSQANQKRRSFEIEQLMSRLGPKYNKKRGQFNCSAEDIGEEVREAMLFMSRFSMKLLDVDNIHVKCFAFEKFKNYTVYMEQYLQKRKIQREYVQWETNNPRVKDNECIWKDPELMKTVRSFLVQSYDYYKFCDQCIGSEDDLFALSE